MKIYLAGALTRVSDVADRTLFYEQIAGICQQLHFEVYVPHISKRMAPVPVERLAPKDIFEWDIDHIRASDLVIAYVGVTSFGVGIELGFAACLDIPVITICERGTVVSPMVLGHPCLISHIEFGAEEECLQTLADLLQEMHSVKTVSKVA